MTTRLFSHPNTLMIAHRGLSGLEAENTCAAFVAAGNRSYFGIETDIHRTADGQYVTIHDDRTGRVCCTDIPVEESCIEELRSLNLYDHNSKHSRSDLRIPSLHEYLEICSRYEKTAVLELKNAFSKENVGEILQIIRDCRMIDRTILISFYFENLVFARDFAPNMIVQYLVGDLQEGLVERLVTHRIDLDIRHTMLTKELLDTLHDAGRKVNVWTVDDVHRASELADMGVDYITSNICE